MMKWWRELWKQSSEDDEENSDNEPSHDDEAKNCDGKNFDIDSETKQVVILIESLCPETSMMIQWIKCDGWYLSHLGIQHSGNKYLL